jgi:hypothetical protein
MTNTRMKKYILGGAKNDIFLTPEMNDCGFE